jgi:uncharacterized protein (DUF2062 family)
MQRWLEHITPQRRSLEQLWCLKRFTALAVERGCWSFRRESVVRAFSLGLLIAFIPPTPLPVHLTLCVLLGILFRLNLPVLFATVFISNPFTWCLQIVGSVWVGAKLMGVDLVPFVHELGRPTLWPHLSQLWLPLLLGALVLGLLAGGLGYVLAQIIWRARVRHQLRRRRTRSMGRGAALEQNAVD